MAHPAPSLSTADTLKRTRDGRNVDLRGQWLVDADLKGVDLTGADLRDCDLSRADLRGACLAHADLRGATLFETRLDGAELMAARLDGANLGECSAVQAGFGQARLEGACMVGARLERASLTSAVLDDADLRGAHLAQARLREASLQGAELSSADLRGADLSDAQVDRACFRRADLRDARLSGVRGYTHADWVGADLRSADFVGASLLRQHALDQNFLHEFREQGPANKVIYALWHITSDCGRSLGRWGLWTLLLAVVYAGLYTQVNIDYGDAETWLSPFYFSVVTLTTLGYGDALPTDVLSQAVVISQVLLGYFMLGGLLSIFSAKMGRRGD